MTRDQISKIVQQQIDAARQGRQSENPKFDFKLRWYDLSIKRKDYYEFLKDTSSMANTFGLDGLIVIGYNDANDSFEDSLITNSGLPSSLEITQLVIKNIVEPFDFNLDEIVFEGNNLSVIHIPSSISKPHSIKQYKSNWIGGNSRCNTNHAVFVRKDSGTSAATKYDLDLMYYDKKNVQPEYELIIDTTKVDIGNYDRRHGYLILPIFFTIENIGRRPIAIKNMRIIASFQGNEMVFSCDGWTTPGGMRRDIKPRDLTIESGKMLFIDELIFTKAGELDGQLTRAQFIDEVQLTAVIELTNRKKLNVKMRRTNNDD